MLVLYGLYRVRLAAVARRFNTALDARVNERLRISRELHDTLLQGFQGMLLRIQSGLLLWPAAEGREMLEKAVDRANEALTEGRDAVQGLRLPGGNDDLAGSIRELAHTLQGEHSGKPVIDVRVLAQGVVHPIHPLVREELFRIAGEALRNAFTHAQARNVEVELRYDARQLRIRVRDDGKGMDRDILEHGREGHFGLEGMRERAMMIDAKLVLWSARDSGTEVEVTVPASAAYAPADSVKARRNPAEARS